MKVVKVYNNSIVLARIHDRHVIVIGTGCGFGKKPGDAVDPTKVDMRFPGYRTFGVSFGAVFCCVGAVVRVLKLGWPGFMGGQKVCLGSGFFVVVPRDKSV